MLEMRPDSEGQLIQVKSILDNESDLFAWLSFLDFNVYIIIILMLVIGVINVGSAMLVIIVLRTNLIGILKAMGATNWSIRKIFLYQAAYLICKGLFYGNLIGISLCWLQSAFGIIALNPTIYYIDKVPMELTIFNWMAINLITFFVCIASLIIPSYVVTSISPTKAINFN
jgi:lipoprotein-releasing system permease protein